MNEERSKLEYELIVVEKKLDKEKRKRNFIMVTLSSILCGIVMYTISGGINTLENFLYFIIMSIFFGTILYFVSISAFAAVTDLFTNIPHLKDRKSALEEKLNKIILNGK